MIDVMRSPLYSDIPNIDHAFFTRKGGVSEGAYATLNCAASSGDDELKIGENRRRAAAFLGAKLENLALCRQVHSPDVATILGPQEGIRPQADALVTRRRDIMLGILTADCVPVLFLDPDAQVIGAAHAGWRGALTGVLQNTVDAMEKLGARRHKILAAVGPCIWQDSYEVGPEFSIPFLAQSTDNEKFFRAADKRAHHMFDLAGYVFEQLTQSGLGEVEASPADTFAESDRFYSYRRSWLAGERETGRLLSAIMIKD